MKSYCLLKQVGRVGTTGLLKVNGFVQFGLEGSG
jgi:hypothetical protein